jgi:hypothetical protein
MALGAIFQINAFSLAHQLLFIRRPLRLGIAGSEHKAYQ